MVIYPTAIKINQSALITRNFPVENRDNLFIACLLLFTRPESENSDLNIAHGYWAILLLTFLWWYYAVWSHRDGLSQSSGCTQTLGGRREKSHTPRDSHSSKHASWERERGQHRYQLMPKIITRCRGYLCYIIASS